MQVLDILDKYEGQKIRIGAVNGSAYFWIGIVNENMTLELMELWKEYKVYFDKRINTFGRRLESAKALEDFYRENPGDFPYQLLEIEELRKKFREAKEQRKACVNPLRRNVVDVFQSISEDNTTCFLVDGYEVGRAWTSDEWNGGFKNGGKPKEVS